MHAVPLALAPGALNHTGLCPCPAQCVARTSSERLVLSLVVVGAAAARTDTLLRLRGAATAFWARVLAAATLLLRACMVCVHCALMRVPQASKGPLGMIGIVWEKDGESRTGPPIQPRGDRANRAQHGAPA
jgi:hypothetical protein